MDPNQHINSIKRYTSCRVVREPNDSCRMVREPNDSKPLSIFTKRSIDSSFEAEENFKNMIRFSYGQQPYECRKIVDCPMRFPDKNSRVIHEKLDHIETSLRRVIYCRCNSCLHSNRMIKFSSKEEMMAHRNKDLNKSQTKKPTGANLNYKPFKVALPGIMTTLQR